MNDAELEQAIQELNASVHKAVEHLNIAYRHMKKLTLDLGWDTAYDKISEASMMAGEEALGIADSIAAEDGESGAKVVGEDRQCRHLPGCAEVQRVRQRLGGESAEMDIGSYVCRGRH